MPKLSFSVLWPLGLYLSLCLLYLFVIPSGESPDEPGHLVCVAQVAESSQLPVVNPVPAGEVWWARGNIVSGRMCYHMPLYYLVAGWWYGATAVLFHQPVHFEFPPSNPAGPSPAMFLHPEKTYFWQLPEPVHLVALRFLSVGLGLVMVWGCYRVAAYWAGGQTEGMILSAVLAAGWPQFVFASRGVSNDVLVTSLAVVLLVVLLDVGKPRRFWLAGLLSSLILLTKLSLSVTWAVVFITWLVEYIALRQAKNEYKLALMGCCFCWIMTGLLLFFHPVLRLHVEQTVAAISRVSEQAKNGRYWLDVLIFTASSGSARFGWMNVPAPMWQAYLWWGGVLGTAVFGSYHLWHQATRMDQRLRLLITAVWSLGVLVSYLQINLAVFQPQFRFAFALIPVFTSFSAVGTLALTKQNKHKQHLLVPLVTFLLLIWNIWIIWAVVAPAYGWQLFM